MIGLMKISRPEFITDFVQSGNLFFNTVEYYKKDEDDHRFDQYEGYDVVIPASQISKLKLNGHEFKVDPDQKPIKMITIERKDFTHVCCFTKIKGQGTSYKSCRRIFNPRMAKFGESFCVILDVKAFLGRVHDVLNNDPEIISHAMSEVKYFSHDKYVRDAFPFQKRKKYCYQDEFRIAVSSTREEGFKVNLGDITQLTFGPYEISKCINVIEKGNAIFI